MKNFKLLGALALVLALTLTACGNKDAEETKEEGAKETETEQVATNDDAEEDAANDDVEEDANSDTEVASGKIEQEAEEDGASDEGVKFTPDNTDCLIYQYRETPALPLNEVGSFSSGNYQLAYATNASFEEIQTYFDGLFADYEDRGPGEGIENVYQKSVIIENSEGNKVTLEIMAYYNDRMEGYGIYITTH